jgi:LmbE family N-acetylglucosaminyl deacetylase
MDVLILRNLTATVVFLVLLTDRLFISPSSIRTLPEPQVIASSDRRGKTAFAQTLQELTNPFSIICVAAHIDDADYNTLAYYRYKYGVRIGIIFALRDESGADAAVSLHGNSFATAKTREALEACHTIGAAAYFLNLRDFGYAKSADEVLNHWREDEAVTQMVGAIRTLRPDIIITSHNGESGDGYQRAIGRVLRTAFTATGDTKVRATGDANSWQPKRLYLQTDFGDSDTFINLLESNHLLGGAYAEIHPLIGKPNEKAQEREKRFYKLALPASGEKPSFGAPFFVGLTLPDHLTKSIAPPLLNGRSIREAMMTPDSVTQLLIENLVEKRAEGSVETLRERYGAEFFRVVRYIELLERAVALALGISWEFRLSDKTIARGESLAADLIFHNGSNQPLSMVFHTPEALSPQNSKITFRRSEVITVSPFSKTIESLRYECPMDMPLTLPHSQHLYDEQLYPASQLQLSQEPFGWTLAAFAEINLGQTTLSLPALQKYDVAAPVEISVTPPFGFVKDWSVPREVEVTVRAWNRTRGAINGSLWVVPLALTTETYEPLQLRFAREDEEVIVNLRLKLPIIKPPLSPDILVEFRREKPASPEALAAVKIPVKIWDCSVAEELRVGYIAQADSPLSIALATLGVEKTALRVEDLSTSQHGVSPQANLNREGSDLSRFHSIIVDALAYSATPDLLAKNRYLLEYARRGGNLIVLYQRDRVWDYLFRRTLFSPFPLALSDNHITNEGSPIKFHNLEHPLLLKPNPITEKDFAGWSRNRSFYLPQHWTADYEALLESADAGEETRKGLLLVARYEAGSFVYTSLDLSKQFAEANPGSYRLLANLISYPKFLKPQQQR